MLGSKGHKRQKMQPLKFALEPNKFFKSTCYRDRKAASDIVEMCNLKAELSSSLTHYRPAMPIGNRKKSIPEDLLSLVLSQIKKISPLWKPEI